MSPTVAPKTTKDARPSRFSRLFSPALKARWQDPKFRAFALGTAAVLLVSTLGVALFFAPRGGSQYVEVYVTDLPGDFEKFQLSVAGVYVGDEAYELQLDAKEFDILQYQGTGNALLLAYGDVPEGDHGKLSVVFTRAQAYFAGQWVPIPIPKKMLTITDGFDLAASNDGALLLDLDMERSLVLSERGYAFEPYVKNLYKQALPESPVDPAHGSLAKNGFTAPPTVDPGQKREDPPPQKDPDTNSPSPSSSDPGCGEDCDTGTDPGGGDEEGGGSAANNNNLMPQTTTPRLPEGNVSGPECPKGEYENPDNQDPAKWAQLRLLDEACSLNKITELLYTTTDGSGDQLFTYIGQVAKQLQNGGPVTVPKGASGYSISSSSVSTYQGLPDVDVDAILDNLPDLTFVLDPVTGSVLTPDAIQTAASEIVRLGGQPLFAYSMSPAIAFQASPQDAWVISQSDHFDWVELAVEGAEILLDSLSTANVNTQLSSLRTVTGPEGQLYDGHGIGVAIIDTGVDGLHRDLPYDEGGWRLPNAAILQNCYLNPPKNTYGIGAIPLIDQSTICGESPFTDVRGHGTMVAGVLLGRSPPSNANTDTILLGAGVTYDGKSPITTALNAVYGPTNTAANLVQRGVAPEAKGYAISFAGDGMNILIGTLAYDRLLWMLDHPIPGDPRILVVTNSWETAWSSTDENSLLYWQIDQVVDRGVTVVFSAGNGGGDGITSMTSPECVHPREGVVCVGAVEDSDIADRSRVNTWFASSRGGRFSPTTWPDLCAPGTRLRTTYPTVLAPNTVGGIATGTGLTNPYALFTGTSAAAPYAAGVVALMQQARNDMGYAYLSPAAVEYVLEQSAYAFPNVSGGYALSPDPRYNMSSYECGHGLVDSKRAVELALSQP